MVPMRSVCCVPCSLVQHSRTRKGTTPLRLTHIPTAPRPLFCQGHWACITTTFVYGTNNGPDSAAHSSQSCECEPRLHSFSLKPHPPAVPYQPHKTSISPRHSPVRTHTPEPNSYGSWSTMLSTFAPRWRSLRPTPSRRTLRLTKQGRQWQPGMLSRCTGESATRECMPNGN